MGLSHEGTRSESASFSPVTAPVPPDTTLRATAGAVAPGAATYGAATAGTRVANAGTPPTTKLGSWRRHPG